MGFVGTIVSKYRPQITAVFIIDVLPAGEENQKDAERIGKGGKEEHRGLQSEPAIPVGGEPLVM